MCLITFSSAAAGNASFHGDAQVISLYFSSYSLFEGCVSPWRLGEDSRTRWSIPGTKRRGTAKDSTSLPQLPPPPPTHCLTLRCYFTKTLSGVWRGRDRTSERPGFLKASALLLLLSWLCHGSASEEILTSSILGFFTFLLTVQPGNYRAGTSTRCVAHLRNMWLALQIDGIDRRPFPCNTGRGKFLSTLFELVEKWPWGHFHRGWSCLHLQVVLRRHQLWHLHVFTLHPPRTAPETKRLT